MRSAPGAYINRSETGKFLRGSGAALTPQVPIVPVALYYIDRIWVRVSAAYASFCFNHSYISIHLYRARSAATEYNFAIGVFDFVDTHAYNKTGTVCLRLVMLSPTPQLGFWIHVLEDGMIELLPCEAGLRRHGGVKGVFDPPPGHLLISFHTTLIVEFGGHRPSLPSF